MAFYYNIIQSFSSFVGTDARQIGKDCIAVGFRLPALVAGLLQKIALAREKLVERPFGNMQHF